MSRSNPTEFTLAATKGGKRPESKAEAKKVSKKKKRNPRPLLGNGFAGQAMDALAAKRKREEEQANQ